MTDYKAPLKLSRFPEHLYDTLSMKVWESVSANIMHPEPRIKSIRQLLGAVNNKDTAFNHTTTGAGHYHITYEDIIISTLLP